MTPRRAQPDGVGADGLRVGARRREALVLDTQRVDAALTEAGVLARAFPGEGIRITIGAPEANRRALAALAGVRMEARR